MYIITIKDGRGNISDIVLCDGSKADAMAVYHRRLAYEQRTAPAATATLHRIIREKAVHIEVENLR